MATHAVETVVVLSAVAGVGIWVGEPVAPHALGLPSPPPAVEIVTQVDMPVDLFALTQSVKWEQVVDEPQAPTF